MRKRSAKGTSVVEGSIEIGMNEEIKKDTMITFVGVTQVFWWRRGNGRREWAKLYGAGCKATAIGLGGSIILSGRRIEMKGV